MSLLRIYGSLLDAPQRCQWALITRGDAVTGEGPLAELPRGTKRIQLVLPATQVFITLAHVPQKARHNSGPTLAFAVEERTASEPDGNQVGWLGTVDGHDALAVVDKAGLAHWRVALGAVGIREYEVHSEVLLLPLNSGEWSMSWSGGEGFIRTGEFEGAAVECGVQPAAPLSLRLMLEEARVRGASPGCIAVHAISASAAPDIEAWTRELGVPMRLAGPWDWRNAPAGAGVRLFEERARWGAFSGTTSRLRPAALILAFALAIHATALAAGWLSLAQEQRDLRQRMDSRFRATFPDAVAVADPVLQMRRKLAQARHAAGQSDRGDFLPMIGQVAAAVKDLPAGDVRVVSYESGRMTIAFSTADEAAMRRVGARLVQAGLSVDVAGPKLITLGAL